MRPRRRRTATGAPGRGAPDPWRDADTCANLPSDRPRFLRPVTGCSPRIRVAAVPRPARPTLFPPAFISILPSAVSRSLVVITSALALGLGLWWLISSGDRGDTPLATTVPAPPPPPPGNTEEQATTAFPPELVFSRAFWRRPDPADQIRHAERREWSDPDGVTRWQFFLAVDPGPALSQWLATNPFSLVTVTTLERDIPDPPEWFPNPGTATGATLQQSASGNLVVITTSGGGTVFVTDHGRGFSRPVTAPAPDGGRPTRKPQ